MRVHPVIRQISSGAVEIVSINHTDELDAGDTLTGTPTITEVETTDLTLSSKQVNSGALVIENRDVAIGKAVQFKIQGQKAGTTYLIKENVKDRKSTRLNSSH